MRATLAVLTATLLLSPALAAGEVTDIKAVCRNGQTFVTWKDAAEGEAGAKLRYALYRSEAPITQGNLDQAEKRIWGIVNNSAKLYTFSFNGRLAVDRLDPKRPTCVIEEGGKPLPDGSGVAVVTVDKAGKRYYAVVATDPDGKPLSPVVAGKSATSEPVEEQVAPVQPVRVWSSKERQDQRYALSGEQGLPLLVSLHASGGYSYVGTHPSGDYYNYFGPREWGYQEGMPGSFSVDEDRFSEPKGTRQLRLQPTECIVDFRNGVSPLETYWFGYYCVPQWAAHKEPRAYPFTERRTLWTIDWVIKKYGADPERVYGMGGSMGAWGSISLLLRHPEVFAALYPTMPRMRQRGLPGIGGYPKGNELMEDGKTNYLERMDSVRFASEHHEDLPFLGWAIGRQDGFATWQEQADMVKALTASHHGFAFAWNNGTHGTDSKSGSAPMNLVKKYYPPAKFARNRSYPAFGNSSINQDPGPGDPKAGDMEGGINLGFIWKDVVDEAGKWSVKLSNDLAKAEMTVDVTPRRCQQFKLKAGDKLKWTNSAGGAGDVAADQWGLVTIEKVKIAPGAETVLTITK
ncbi:MAG TPA: hypothetical protein PK280_13745 [Planctomycetota bacterium]|nr:hypothetical protein [Planctomycetota bacterium]